MNWELIKSQIKSQIPHNNMAGESANFPPLCFPPFRNMSPFAFYRISLQLSSRQIEEFDFYLNFLPAKSAADSSYLA